MALDHILARLADDRTNDAIVSFLMELTRSGVIGLVDHSAGRGLFRVLAPALPLQEGLNRFAEAFLPTKAHVLEVQIGAPHVGQNLLAPAALFLAARQGLQTLYIAPGNAGGNDGVQQMVAVIPADFIRAFPALQNLKPCFAVLSGLYVGLNQTPVLDHQFADQVVQPPFVSEA